MIYLFVFFGGWKLFKSKNPILIEVGIAIPLSVFVFAGNEAAIELEKRVKALDEGFTIDCPIVVGKAHGQIIELYEDGGVFVLEVMDAAKTKGSHWHPNDVESAIDDIVNFMEGKSDYKMCHFRKV